MFRIFCAGLAAVMACACSAEQDGARGSAAPEPPGQAPSGPAAPLPDAKSAVAPALRPFVGDMPTVTFNKVTLPLVRMQTSADDIELPEGVVEMAAPSRDGGRDVTVYVFDPSPDEAGKPAYLHMHGGGYVVGSARSSATHLPGIAAACGCVVASVDYRLAPETPFPGPMEDNFAALEWLVGNADDMGVDAGRIAIGGESAGGGHAAQLAIAARDRGIAVAFQVLIYPMLDDRTGGARPVPDHIGRYIWNAASNQFAWSAYLGQAAGGDVVPYGSVPARVEDLTGLPPAWIGVGGVDLFMAENLEYARRLTEAGVPVELRLTPGGFHAFDFLAGDTAAARAFRESWTGALYAALHDAGPTQ